MLPAQMASVDVARQLLERVGVPERLQHVRSFIWRGGTLRWDVELREGRQPNAYFELTASWDAAVLEPDIFPPTNAVVPVTGPVVEGRWTRSRAGYVLRVGLNLAVPSAIYIRSQRLQSFIPFVGRADAQVEHALGADLEAYATWFLGNQPTVPEATATAARDLRRYRLD